MNSAKFSEAWPRIISPKMEPECCHITHSSRLRIIYVRNASKRRYNSNRWKVGNKRSRRALPKCCSAFIWCACDVMRSLLCAYLLAVRAALSLYVFRFCYSVRRFFWLRIVSCQRRATKPSLDRCIFVSEICHLLCSLFLLRTTSAQQQPQSWQSTHINL